jgi:hypothetical protein
MKKYAKSAFLFELGKIAYGLKDFLFSYVLLRHADGYQDASSIADGVYAKLGMDKNQIPMAEQLLGLYRCSGNKSPLLYQFALYKNRPSIILEPELEFSAPAYSWKSKWEEMTLKRIERKAHLMTDRKGEAHHRYELNPNKEGRSLSLASREFP